MKPQNPQNALFPNSGNSSGTVGLRDFVLFPKIDTFSGNFVSKNCNKGPCFQKSIHFEQKAYAFLETAGRRGRRSPKQPAGETHKKGAPHAK